ncbi:MAG: hypothetical protein ACR2N5_00315 [Solirubrobacterales bacterium]
MGSRERKRATRRKRKDRSAKRQEEEAAAPVSPDAEPAVESEHEGQNGGAPPGIEELADVGELSRSERKNLAARQALVPLREGERPLAVTIGAVVSTVLFAAAVAGWLLWDVFRDDVKPSVVAVFLFAAVVGAMAYGMWRVQYWAVLGFQAVLLFSILGSAIGIVRALTLIEAAGNFIVLAGAGTLFYFMVKAMARIQMPERRPR